MAVCWIKAGWCGHEVVIDTDKKDANTMVFSLDTSCPYLKEMHDQFKEINIQEELASRMTETRTYKMAAQFIPCVGCPVPSAMLKSVEVLSGSYHEEDTLVKFLHFNGQPPEAMPKFGRNAAGD
jgi:hypothetical protein